MNEDQEKKIDTLIGKAEKANRIFIKLTWTLLIVGLTALVSVTKLVITQVNEHKDLVYLREQALNKDAFFSYLPIDKAHDKAVLAVIKDENTRDAIMVFNEEKQSVIDMILASQTEIVPRGFIDNQSKKFAK
jgi:hypothetical protein